MLTPLQALSRLLILSAASFALAVAWTPILTSFLYRYKLGKRIRNTGSTPVFTALHQQKAGTPTMGGLLVWVTTVAIVLGTVVVSDHFAGATVGSWNILSRSQTYLPLGFLMIAALVGLADDLMNVFGVGPNSGGLRMRHRIVLYTAIAVVGALWFYAKLSWTTLYIPFHGFVDMGWWMIPFFILVIVATGFSVNEIDGLDGLAGGTLLISFTALAVIAFLEGKYELSALIGVLCGALLAFLWFNIYPARFFMGDTGAMSLGITLGVVAMLTNTALLLPIIGFLFVMESLSVCIQLFSRTVFKRKIFRSSPIHHHFEALGWGEPKIVMRFWVIGGVVAMVGIILVLVDPSFPRGVLLP